VDLIQQYHEFILEKFSNKADISPIRQNLDKLMMSQIQLLKVYNNTPSEGFDTHLSLVPVTMSIQILKVVFSLNDV
jgi:hypothetical protein